MARRKSSGSVGASLDSLLDTLTNVVGILIIILIVTQITASQAIERIKGFVEEISEEQYAQTIAESEELRDLFKEQQDKQEELATAAPQTRLSIEDQRKLAESLKDRLAQINNQTVDAETLRKELEQRRTKTTTLEEQIAKQQSMIAILKARLAETPAAGPAPDAKVVNLPDPRPAPKGAEKVVFCCRDGYVFPIFEDRLQAEAQERMERGKKVLLKEGKIDCEKLTELFDSKFVGDDYVKLGIKISTGDAKPYLLINHREKEGEETERISRRNSRFNGWLDQINPQKQWIEFRVWNDSFDTYLAARNEAASRGFTAGWLPYAENSEYWLSISTDLNTTCFGVEPNRPAPTPRDPNAPPPPPADTVD